MRMVRNIKWYEAFLFYAIQSFMKFKIASIILNIIGGLVEEDDKKEQISRKKKLYTLQPIRKGPTVRKIW